jgi:hypothetical protein
MRDVAHGDFCLLLKSLVELLPNFKIRRYCLVASEGGGLGDTALQGKRRAKAREQVT